MHGIHVRFVRRLGSIGVSGAMALVAGWASGPAAAPVTALAANTGPAPAAIHAESVGLQAPGETAGNRDPGVGIDHSIGLGSKSSAKLAAGGGTSHSSAADGGGGSKAGVWDSHNWPGINFADVSSSPFRGPTPPDPNGVVGPNNYMEAVNGHFAVYDRDGHQLAGAADDYFAGRNRQSPQRFMSDPTVNYDPRTNRWFYQEASFNRAPDCPAGRPACNFEIDFGWSATGDPSNLDGVVPQTPGWCHYIFFVSATLLFDYTKTAVDDKFMYFTSNVFDFAAGGAFVSANLVIFPKPAAGTLISCPGLAGFGYGPPFGGGQLQHPGTTEPVVTITPASTFATGPGSTTYMASARYACFSGGREQVLIMHLDIAPATPVFYFDGEQTVPHYSCPPNVPEPAGREIDTLDGRIAQVAAIADPSQGGKMGVWTAHNVALGAGADNIAIQWYEILMPVAGGAMMNAPSLAQSGSLGGGLAPPKFTFAWNPGIAPTTAGNEAVINYNWSEATTPDGSTTTRTQLRAASHDPGMATGLMSLPVTLANSLDDPVDFSCPAPGGVCRWGDYAGASTDPRGNHVVWGTNQWTGLRHADPATSTFMAQWATNNFAISAAGSGATQSGPFIPITPNRIIDTRPGTQVGPYGAPIGTDSFIDVQVTGTPGVPASGVGAVVLNVTGLDATMPTYFTVWPQGVAKPLASTLNFGPFQQVANLTEIPVGATGKVSIYNKNGTADAIVDVFGYTLNSLQTTTAGLFKGMVPNRIMDTRLAGGAFAAGETRTLQVASTLADSRANAVVLNVTAVGGSAPSFLTVWPADAAQPTVSNVNFPAGKDVPNRVMVKLGVGPVPANIGAVKIYNSAGSVNVVVDANGWFTDGTDPRATGGTFHPLTNARILDSRPGTAIGQYTTQWGTDTTRIVIVGGNGGVPLSGASAVVANATITNSSSGSFLTLYPTGASQLPLASDMNWIPGDTLANMAVVRLGGDYSIYAYNKNAGVDVVIDVTGYYG